LPPHSDRFKEVLSKIVFREIIMKTRILIAVLVLVVVVFAAGAIVQASHKTEMEMCASHGLGPNFYYAEGPNSALIHCLETANTSHP
jgi:hypothetical protein